MTADELLGALRRELNRFRESSEDPTTEPVTLAVLETILDRIVRDAE